MPSAMLASSQASIDELVGKIAHNVKESSTAKGRADLLVDLELWSEMTASLNHGQRHMREAMRKGNPARRLEAFSEWLQAEGFDSSAIEIASFGDEGNGLRAKKNISKGELVVQVPEKFILRHNSPCDDATLNEVLLRDGLVATMPSMALALRLLHEVVAPDSYWWAYTAILPPSFNTPYYLTPEDWRALSGSPCLVEVHRCIKNTLRQYCYLYQVLKDKNVLQDVFSWNNFVWALSVAMTRQNQIPLLKEGAAVEGSSSLALIPVWDMCNHTPDGQISTFYDVASQSTECIAIHDFKEGDQVFIYYGDRPNSELFLHSGFTVANNPQDTFKFVLGIDESDPLATVKEVILSQQGVARSCTFTLSASELDPNLLAFLRLLSLNKDEIKDKVYAEVFAGGKATPRAEAAVASTLTQLCTSFLEGYSDEGTNSGGAPQTDAVRTGGGEAGEEGLRAGGGGGGGGGGSARSYRATAIANLIAGEKRILEANLAFAKALVESQ